MGREGAPGNSIIKAVALVGKQSSTPAGNSPRQRGAGLSLPKDREGAGVPVHQFSILPDAFLSHACGHQCAPAARTMHVQESSLCWGEVIVREIRAVSAPGAAH